MAEALTNAEVVWHWYAGDNDEVYTTGPHSSRDEALTEACGMGWERIVLCEACKVPVKLSSYFSTEGILEAVSEDDDLTNEYGDGVEISTTPEQSRELEALVRAVIDDWQARHKIIIDPWAFTEVRKVEEVEVDFCPVCTEPLRPNDICATDVEMGICHEQCLKGSPVVDVETGEPIDGPATTFRYGDVAGQKGGE